MYRRLRDILMRTAPMSEEMVTGIDCDIVERVDVTVFLLFFLVCLDMGLCYMKLLQFDAAEEAFSQSLKILTTIFPQGNDDISTSETDHQ